MIEILSIADDDVGLHVLGCWVDILGTNCNVSIAVVLSFLYPRL